jgi:hypothetical protein
MKAKIPFSARITDLTKALLACEVKEGGGTEADALERLAIKASATSAEATKLVLAHLETDSRMKSLVAIALKNQVNGAEFHGNKSGNKR